MEDFLQQYGYLALMVGTFIEGETAILVASSLVYSGMLSAPETIIFGFFGSFISDWTYYLTGRFNGIAFVSRRPSLQVKLYPARRFFESHRLLVLSSYRFLYGFRIVLPLLIGLTGVRPAQFLLFSVGTGLLWSSLVALLGYFAGSYFEFTPESFERHAIYIIVGFASFGLLLGYTIKFLSERFLGAPPKKPNEADLPAGPR